MNVVVCVCTCVHVSVCPHVLLSRFPRPLGQQDIILTVKLAIKERFLMGYLCDPEVQTALLRVDMARLKKTSVTPGYPREWEFFVSKAESYGQLLLLWRLLSESIDWRSSIKAVVGFCEEWHYAICKSGIIVNGSD